MSTHDLVEQPRYQVANKISLNEAERVAGHFVKSGFFKDANSVSKCVVKIMAGAEYGLGAFAACHGLHVIQGGIHPSANLLACMLKRSNVYDFRVPKGEHTEKSCRIVFYRKKSDGSLGEELGDSVFTVDDAKKAGTQNMQKYPKNMLFARCLVNGVRWHTPDVFGGGITPYIVEEMSTDFTIKYDGTLIVNDEDKTVVMNAEIVPPQGEEQKLLKEECEKRGLTLKDFSSILEIDEDSLLSATQEEARDYLKLLKNRKVTNV